MKLILLIFLFPIIGFSETNTKLTFVTEDYPPFNFSDASKASVLGITTDVVREILLDANIKATFEVLPWARAYSLAEKNENTCIFSIARTAEREATFKWVGPVVSNDWMLFGLKQDTGKFKDITQLQDKLVGSYIGDAAGKHIQDLGYKVEFANRDNLNIKKLLGGRIDFWITGNLPGQYLLKQQNISDIVPLLSVRQIGIFIACNKKTNDAIIVQLTNSLKNIKSKGLIEKAIIDNGYRP